MLPGVNDSLLPGLSVLDKTALARITGQDSTQVLRYRHRPGKRAVLHIATSDAGPHSAHEGVIWFFAGNKARRLAERLPASHYDLSTQALYEQFPQDHRLPEIQAFLMADLQDMQAFIGGELAEPPHLERYRPGLSCTFRCNCKDGTAVFVKILAHENVEAIANLNWQLRQRLGIDGVSIARGIAICPQWQAIAYQMAEGEQLTYKLNAVSQDDVRKNFFRTLSALDQLSGVTGLSARFLGEKQLVSRAKKACNLIANVDEDSGHLARKRLQRICCNPAVCRQQLIHGDMKSDHVFIDERVTTTEARLTFVDTESLSIGDPYYDIALLEARLMAEALKGELREDSFGTIQKSLVDHVDKSRYDWFFDIAILQVAKSFAQRPATQSIENCRALLRLQPWLTIS